MSEEVTLNDAELRLANAEDNTKRGGDINKAIALALIDIGHSLRAIAEYQSH